MKCTHLLTVAASFLLSAVGAHAADLSLPINIIAGSARTSVVLGIATGATDGYDKGWDVPPADVGDSLTAVIPHLDWSITSPDGKPITGLYRDIRGSLPQQYRIQITSTTSPVTLSWDTVKLPATLTATLSASTGNIDMKKQGRVTLPDASSTVTIALDEGDTAAPAEPEGLHFELKGTSFYLTWEPNAEADIAGYKLYWTQKGGFIRTVDLKRVTNFNLMNIIDDVPYQIAVSAYDSNGNESAQSSILTAVKAATSEQQTIADGDVDGDARVTIVDAIKILRMALGLDATTATDKIRGDMDGDGALTIRDALKIIRKVVGLK